MRSIHGGRTVMQGSLATIVIVAAGVVVGAGLAGCTSRAGPPRVPPPPTVTVVEARKANIPAIVNTQGTTRAINDVTIRARVKGFLEEMHFAEGSDVKKGQLLLVIDEEQYRVALEQAKASLAEAESNLKKAEQSKAREIAEAQLHLDEAQRALDQVEEKRERSLLTRNASTIEDVERRQALLKKSTAQVEADRASLEQTRADFDTNILAARAKLDQARANLRDAEINLGYCRMYAPIDGRIGQLLVKLGNLVGPDQNTDLVTIQQLQPMGVDLLPPARYLPRITQLVKGGLFIDLRVEGERQHPHQGKVYFMDNTVEPTTGTFLMKASVPNPDESLLPGEYVGVSANIGEYVDVIIVPEKAVVEGQAGPTAYVVDAKKQVAVVPVKPIDVYRGMRVIDSGLEPGQKVIVEGIQLVRPGQPVEVEETSLDRFFRDESEVSRDARYESPRFRNRSSPGEGRDVPVPAEPGGGGPQPVTPKGRQEPPASTR